MIKIVSVFVCIVSFVNISLAQQNRIPASYSNLFYDDTGRLYFQKDGDRYYADTVSAKYKFNELHGNPKGTDNGIILDFGSFAGTITYGLIPYGKAPHPLPVYRFTSALQDGKIAINIGTAFRDPYDMVGWQQSGQLSIGYRLIDQRGNMIYNGIVSVTGKGPFVPVPTIYEGPFINNVNDTSAVIWFKTNTAVKASVKINAKRFDDPEALTHHEINVKGLKAGTEYKYTVSYGDLSQTYSLKTSPKPGSRKPFVFSYTSDSRAATGGGERNVHGANSYIMKKIAALAFQHKSAFMQFTGDMINGYSIDKEDQILQYSNWKNAVQPFWHYMPVYVGQGNHEAFGYLFRNKTGGWLAFIDGFPYATESAEALMQDAFVNPLNGPESEDGNKYDADKNNIDFPSYKENVFYYTYDNVGMVVLNSDYWYAPVLNRETSTSGGLHGYIMDNQLKWLEETISKLEKDKNIDHIFVTQHTPVFPNGGHVGDDMWYHGNNEKRTYIAGKPVDKGIIERRDEYLNILINKSKKVIAVLTGDEHNYNRLQLTKAVNIYPENYPHKKLNVSRSIFQINNGAAGAPYYAQEKAPWSEHTKAFSVENALCLFYVDGKKIKMKVINPDTLNQIDEIQLR